MNQHEILNPGELLNSDGTLKECGYAKHMLQHYNRKNCGKGPSHIKEWDYYLIGNGKFYVALTIADNGYMGLDSISFLMFDGEPWEITKSPMRVMTLGKTGLPETSVRGITQIAGKDYALKFEVTEEKRHLTAYMNNFKGSDKIEIDIELDKIPEESMVICTPFNKKGHFYFNQKINCMHATGYAKIGNDIYQFNDGDSFGLLDWGRGVWTYHNTWYWGSASGMVDGHDFGWNIGYGFGDTSAASENMLFYDGKSHKLSEVKFNIPGENFGNCRFTEPWTFTSDDGRFEMDFVPIIDRASCTDVKLIKSDQHQVFGKFTGKAVLDDGKVIEVKDFFGFAEKVENKW